MTGIRITWDDTSLQTWGKETTRLLQRGVINSVNKAARQARAEALRALAVDANVPLANLKKAIGPVQTARPGPIIRATWTTKKSRNMVRAPGGGRPAFQRGTPVQAATFVATGGGSANLTLPHGFVITGNGGTQLLVTRTGKGRGAYKVVYAENPNTAMGQPHNIVRQTWELTAKKRLTAFVEAAVAGALVGVASSSAGMSDDEVQPR